MNIENNTKFKNAFKMKTRGWAEFDPKRPRWPAGGGGGRRTVMRGKGSSGGRLWRRKGL
jgi:hypothetical protein